MRNHMRGLSAAALIAGVVLMMTTVAIAADASASPVPPDAPRPRIVTVAGVFRLDHSTITNVRPEGSVIRYDESGTTYWTGDLRGTSTIVGGGTYDPATGVVVSDLHETFDGTVRGVGASHLEWTEHTTAKLATPDLSNTVDVSGQSHARELSGSMRSTITDPGQQTTDGASNVVGSYDGSLVVRQAS